MEKQLLSKKDLLLYAKNATQSILNSLVAIKFIKAELYIVNKDIYSKGHLYIKVSNATCDLKVA